MVFDTETTGLVNNSSSDLKDQPYVIEFAGVLINRAGDIVAEYEQLFKPPVALTKIITDITGLTDEKLKDAKPFDCDAVQNFMKTPGVHAAVAHNFSFDRAMINFEFARQQRVPAWPPVQLCTVEASYPIHGRRMKLAQMYKHFFNEDFVGAHRAMADVKAIARCAAYMIQREMM
jgi:DNA polymerase III alpha subunit (gram-positive type)